MEKKKFIHTFEVKKVLIVTRKSGKDKANLIRLIVKQNWLSPASSLFTRLFSIDVMPEMVGIDPESLTVGTEQLNDLIGKSFTGYYQDGQITVLVDMSECKQIELNSYEEVGKFNLSSRKDTDKVTDVCNPLAAY